MRTRRPLHATLALVTVGALSLGLAACGGDDGGGGADDQAQEVTSMLETGLTTSDPAVICQKTISTGLVDRIYGSQAACVTAEKKDAKDSTPASAVEVSGVKVDGGRGTAFVEIKGGDQDGARGELTVVEQDGGWRVDDLSVPLLRSQFEAGVKNDRELPTALKTCISEKVLGLEDTAFRTLAYGSMGEKPAANEQLATIVRDCAGQSSSSQDSGSTSGSNESASVLRQQFEKGIEESLQKDGVSASAIDCVKGELRSAISDDQIISLIGKSSKDVPPEIASATAGALATCDATK